MARLTDEQLILMESLLGYEMGYNGQRLKHPRPIWQRYQIGFQIPSDSRIDQESAMILYNIMAKLLNNFVEHPLLTIPLTSMLQSELMLKRIEGHLKETHGIKVLTYNRHGEYTSNSST